MKLNKQETILINGSGIDVEERLRKINIIELMKNFKAISFWEKEGLTALLKLIIKLKENIGKYESIVSDDASGRLVSLILQKIANKIRKDNDKDQIRVLFIAGGSGIQNRKIAINKLIENNKNKLGRTLLVTDYIQTGESIEKFMEILNDNNINFDVAAVSVSDDPKSSHHLYSKNLLKRLYYGEFGNAGLQFYSRISFAGVYKNSTSREPFPELQYNKTTDEMKNIREDINLLADKAIEAIK